MSASGSSRLGSGSHTYSYGFMSKVVSTRRRTAHLVPGNAQVGSNRARVAGFAPA